MNDGSPPEPATDPGAIDDGVQLEPPAPPPHRLAVPVGLLVAVTLVVLDQVTKQIALAVLEPGRFVSWLGPHVGWQLVFNPGGAFGIPAPHWLFLLVTVGVVVLVARVLPRTPTLLGAAAYGMLLAGALGNVLDRLFRPGGDGFGTGHVVDFVAWGTFPRFNVADSAITVGFVLLVFALLQEERRAEAALREAAADPPGAEPHLAPAVTGTDADGTDRPGAGDTERDPTGDTAGDTVGDTERDLAGGTVGDTGRDAAGGTVGDTGRDAAGDTADAPGAASDHPDPEPSDDPGGRGPGS